MKSGNPVDDIDLVFDYPSEGQGSYQKQSLETSGLDLHSAMPHHPKAGMQGQTTGASKVDDEMGVSGSNAMYVTRSLSRGLAVDVAELLTPGTGTDTWASAPLASVAST
jgi:hypothetical protein